MTSIRVFWNVLMVLCTVRYCVSEDASDGDFGEPCTETFCKKTINNIAIKYAALVQVNDKAYNRTAEKEVRVSGTMKERIRKCADACTDEGVDKCKATHLEPYLASNLDSLCSLFSKDVYGQYPDETVYLRKNATGYVSFHLKNTFCEKSLCQNNAYCAANFTHDNGTCVCKGYSGKYCETYDVLHYDDVLHYNFDNGKFENIGFGKDYWGTGTLDQGKIIGLPSRRSKGVACYKGKKPCMRPIPDEKSKCVALFSTFQDFKSVCSSGLTIGFWIRLLWNESGSGIFALSHRPGFHFYTASGRVIFGFDFKNEYHDCFLTYDQSISVKQWAFAMATWNPKDEKFWCIFNDEEAMSSERKRDGDNPTKLPFTIGNQGYESFLMDDFIYFERTSTTEEMKQIYEQTKDKP